VFVDDLERPALHPDDRHHLARVRRIRPGDALTISDGAGAWRPARMGDAVEPTGATVVVTRSHPLIAVAFAPVKGDRPELVAQKLTELGVDRIVPILADRSVVRWEGERAERNVARLRRVAREAAMQARRCHLPEVMSVAACADVAAGSGCAAAVRDGAAPTLDHPTVLVGPEGGWSPRELAAFGHQIGLAEQVLRAETAAITAAALLCGLRSRVVAPVGTGRRR
jgi:16S rRNA (uracil1498-N3)-methyltransferase